MGEHIRSALEEAERVVKKQKTCASQTSDIVNNILGGLQQVQHQAQRDPSSTGAAVEAFSKALAKQDASRQVTKATKDLHSSVGKLGKALEKAFIQDASRAHRDLPFESATLDEVIAAHFFQEGNFEVGDHFLREAKIPNGQAIKKPYEAMHSVLREIQVGNLRPALEWAASNRQQLIHSSNEERATAFEFKLHRLQFMDTLQKSGQKAALKYARDNFGRFQKTQLAGIQRLMGCLCYQKRPGATPYDDLKAASLWEEAARDFARHCCGMLGQASESPLLVAVAAGSIALPTLVKLASLLKDHSHELVSGEQLPVELELGREFVFRSVFSCPVSREQSSPANPPMLLPCQHVLCKQSIQKIAKSNSRAFKCPYCPREALAMDCQQLFFPPIL